MLNKLKKALAGLVVAIGLSTGVGLVTAASAEAAPAPAPVASQPTLSSASTKSVSGVRMNIVSDKWGLWHGRAVSVQTGRQVYYGPGRFFRSDAWDDVHAWHDGT